MKASSVAPSAISSAEFRGSAKVSAGIEMRNYEEKTYVTQRRRCGKLACSCMEGEISEVGHGSYWYAYWNEGGKPCITASNAAACSSERSGGVTDWVVCFANSPWSNRALESKKKVSVMSVWGQSPLSLCLPRQDSERENRKALQMGLCFCKLLV